uniref:Saposin A-type domain-containing protein n=1 Tax=Parascaris univalens TaxID=6257 RepID=A0A915ALS1_PARUN
MDVSGFIALLLALFDDISNERTELKHQNVSYSTPPIVITSTERLRVEMATPKKVCDIPPDLWCDSFDAAQRCGVLHQCEQFRRSRRTIKLTLIYEALCPYCQRFIINHLGNLYHQFRGQIELELVPWGNSRLLRDGTIKCNHGEVECDANRLHGCVLDTVKVKHALPFIICFERALVGSTVEAAFQHCSGFIRHHYRTIRRCFESDRGIQLQHKAAHRTMSVRPNPIVEVPYILINDYSPNTDTNNLNVFALQHLLKKWLRSIKYRF